MDPARRAEINRQNAQKSTGPRTAAGKAASARNALTHGLTAAVAVVAPVEDADEYRAGLEEWLDDLAPKDVAQRCLVKRAYHAAWRLERCARQEAAALSHRARHAADEHHRAQLDRAERLGQELFFDPINRCESPRRDKESLRQMELYRAVEPAVLARELCSFVEGIDWLLARWTELHRLLTEEGYWHYPDKFNALRMLGLRPEDMLNDLTARRIFQACHKMHPDAWPMWDECFHATFGHEAKPIYVKRTNHLEKGVPATREEAGDWVFDIVEAEIERLKALRASMLPRAEADRAEAVDRALFDPGPEAALLRRYETACERELHRALADLEKSNRPVKSAPAEATPQPPDPETSEPTTTNASPAPPADPTPREAPPARNEPNPPPVVAPIHAPPTPEDPPHAPPIDPESGRSVA